MCFLFNDLLIKINIQNKKEIYIISFENRMSAQLEQQSMAETHADAMEKMRDTHGADITKVTDLVLAQNAGMIYDKIQSHAGSTTAKL